MARSPEPPSQTIEFGRPTRLGLISDTHIFDESARSLSPHVLDAFARMQPTAIVHAGDVATQSVLDRLAEIAPVIAVRGNNDRGAFGDALPEMVTIACLGKKIRVVHGTGGRSAKAVAAETAAGADCVIYGHSHLPDARLIDGTLMLNPGSPNDRRWHPHFGIAYLDITRSGLDPRLIVFASPADLDAVQFDPLVAT